MKECESLIQSLEEADHDGSTPDHQEITGFAMQQQFQTKSHLGLVANWFYRQCSACCYTSLFCDGVITTTSLVRCLGPSRPVRRDEVSLGPRSLEVHREQKKKSAWCTGPWGFDEEGKWDWYDVTLSVTEYGHLPSKMVLVMLTTLPGVSSRVISHTWISKCYNQWKNILCWNKIKTPSPKENPLYPI